MRRVAWALLPALRPTAVPVGRGGLPCAGHRSKVTALGAGGSTVVEQFELALVRDIGVQRGDTVVAMVSGGCDSVAMLHLFAQMDMDLVLHVLHFNHGTRPECTDEEAFVRGLARSLHMDVHVHRLDAAPKSGLQKKTRDWRRAEALRLLNDLRGSAVGVSAHIALGHHADDNMETILMKILRGCHITNVAGMAPKDGPFIRPLLRCTKEDICAWLKHQRLDWKEDSSNRELEYKRNRVRLQLVPLLQELTEGALAQRLAHLTDQSAQMRDLVESQPLPPTFVDGSMSVASILACPLAVQCEAVHGFLESQAGRPSSYGEVRRVLVHLQSSMPESAMHLEKGWVLRRAHDRIYVERLDGAKGSMVETHREGLLLRHIPEVDVDVVLCPAGASAQSHVPQMVLHNVPPHAVLTVRRRRAGDLFHAPDRELPMKLSKLLRAAGLLLHERRRALVVELSQSAAEGKGCAPIVGVVAGDYVASTRHHVLGEGPGGRSVVLRFSPNGAPFRRRDQDHRHGADEP